MWLILNCTFTIITKIILIIFNILCRYCPLKVPIMTFSRLIEKRLTYSTAKHSAMKWLKYSKFCFPLRRNSFSPLLMRGSSKLFAFILNFEKLEQLKKIYPPWSIFWLYVIVSPFLLLIFKYSRLLVVLKFFLMYRLKVAGERERRERTMSVYRWWETNTCCNSHFSLW